MQKLMTKELQKKLPPLYSQDGKKAETIVYGHWFSYFNLAELEEINRKYGLNFFERETNFTPQKVIEVPRIAEAFGYLWEK